MKKQIKKWQVDYVVVYQETGTELEEKWQLSGFIPVANYSWKQYENMYTDVPPYKVVTPE